MKQNLESEDKKPSEVWKSVSQLKEKVSNDPSCNISPNEWLNYFKQLMNIEHINKYENADMYLSHDKNQNIKILNSEVTTEKVQKAAQDLKYGQTSGPDGILNEMLKITCNINAKVIVCFFNAILKSETYPDLWREHFIKPIFKGGCFNDLTNYRGVTLSSCFGNCFSEILSNRLDKFLEENNIICSEQIGFKKYCRTSDYILTLKCLIDKAFKLSKSLYVCFIDLRKAFDRVNREALLYRLSHYKLSIF